MTDRTPGIWSLVLVPAVVTLVVSVVRLAGEVRGWSEPLFVSPGFVGIMGLIPVFGVWFGLRLRRATGQPPHAGKAALRFAIGAAVLVGGFAAGMATGLITMPDREHPQEASGLPYALGAVGLAGVVMFTAWPRLAVTLLVYALLARIPVVVITWLALERGWETHYTHLPPGLLLPADVSKLAFLATPQLAYWPVVTLGLGGLCGCLGAALGGRKAG